jgi:hypothetical protein
MFLYLKCPKTWRAYANLVWASYSGAASLSFLRKHPFDIADPKFDIHPKVKFLTLFWAVLK